MTLFSVCIYLAMQKAQESLCETEKMACSKILPGQPKLEHRALAEKHMNYCTKNHSSLLQSGHTVITIAVFQYLHHTFFHIPPKPPPRPVPKTPPNAQKLPWFLLLFQWFLLMFSMVFIDVFKPLKIGGRGGVPHGPVASKIPKKTTLR